MNISSSQSSVTSAELEYLMSSEAQFITADSKPALGMKQDAMSGGYIFTLGVVPVSKATFMDCCCTVDDWPMDLIMERMDQIRNVHKWKGAYALEVERIKSLLPVCENLIGSNRLHLKALKLDMSLASDIEVKRIKIKYEQVRTQINKLKRRIAHLEDESNIAQEASDNLLYTGHGIISMLLPDNFEYTFVDAKIAKGAPLIITRGVILSGTIAKSSLNNIIHHIYKDHGARMGCDFVSYYQRFMNVLMARRGFSVGLEDCTPFNTELIEKEKEKCFMQAKTVMNTEPDLELRESKILTILNQATDIGERIVREGIGPDNNFMHMIISGAKGSIFNYVNAVNAVGQQNLAGKRAPKDYGGRTLPCYIGTPGNQHAPDQLPENAVLSEYQNLLQLFQSRGFIDSSYFKGLSSPEFFFLAGGGREGLTDTSIKTAKCGYMSRRLLKLMEDMKVAYNGNVVNSKGTVVQFAYGDDNLAAPELIRTEKFGYQCSDICHIADMLNADHEWKEFQNTLPAKPKKLVQEAETEDEWSGGY